MPVLKKGIQFTGTLGEITAYTLPGSDKIYIRSKGGHSKERMLRDPAFDLPLRNASEFGGCAKAARLVRLALRPVQHLREPGLNIIGQAIKIAKKLQKLEKGIRGTRDIYFSRYKQMLNGFNLHPRRSLETIITTPILSSIDREKGQATVTLPLLRPNVNLLIPWNYPMCRFVIHLGVVPDTLHNNNGYCDAKNRWLPQADEVYTNWQFTRNVSDKQTYSIQLHDIEELTNDMTLLLSVGIEMGIQVTDTEVDIAKRAGSAKVLDVA